MNTTIELTPAEKIAQLRIVQLQQAAVRALQLAVDAGKDRERATVALDTLRQKEIRAVQELERLSRELKAAQESAP